MVLLSKFAAFSVATFALAALAVVVQFFVALSATQNPWGRVDELSAVIGVVALAVLANGALFALIGVSIRYPLVFAIIYFVLWENLLGGFPGQIKRFSFIFYERTLVTVAADRTNFLDEFLGLKVSAGAAITTMLVATAVLLAAACVVVSYKDYNV